MRTYGLEESADVSVGQEREETYGLASAHVDNSWTFLEAGGILQRGWAGKAHAAETSC